MPYLVDGNNLMGQRPGWHRDKPGARRGLLEELSQFAARYPASMTVVFDGSPERFFPDGSSYKGVRIFYSERGSNADERIKQLVEATRERRTTLVVTSDRALADYVRRCGAQVVSSGEFRRRMETCSEHQENAAPEERESFEIEAQLPEWMRYFGVAPEDGE